MAPVHLLRQALVDLMEVVGGEPGDEPFQQEAWEAAEAALQSNDGGRIAAALQELMDAEGGEPNDMREDAVEIWNRAEFLLWAQHPVKEAVDTLLRE